MRVIIVVLALVAIAAAAPAEYEPPKILRSTFEQNNEGGYAYSFESEDGTQRDEKGEIKEVLDDEKKPHPVIVVRGFYSYVNSEGKPETVNYYADETGYHAEGESIPKPQSRK
ncbi:unnamed protein product, partial [Brenthis ino]